MFLYRCSYNRDPLISFFLGLGKEIQKINTGHVDNIFSVKFIGECSDSKLITGAMDGQVICILIYTVEAA